MGERGLLLDRDGVVNVDTGYVGAPELFVFMDGIFPLARRAVANGWRIVIVTNQSGIARGYYGEADFAAVTRHMLAGFAEQGVAITGVFYCPCHPDGVVPGYVRHSFWRKPNPGMILEAARRHGLDLPRSLLIGDAASDTAAARAAGVGRCLRLSPDPATQDANADRIIPDLDAAAAFLTPPVP